MSHKKYNNSKFCRQSDGLDLLQTFEQKYITQHVLDLVAKTKDIDIIPRYYIIDAVLASRFNITLKQAMDVWENELQAVALIDVAVKKAHIPRQYQCARFALHVLKHLLLRGQEQTVCSYSYGARNFMVALVKTNQCLCAAYTLYVASMVLHFGYNDYVSECRVPGHIFTVSKNTSGEYLLGFDAGFLHNDYIRVKTWPNSNPQTLPNIEQLLNWDTNIFRWKTKKQLLVCKTRKGSKKSFTEYDLLFGESHTKKSFENTVRNVYILNLLDGRNYDFVRKYMCLMLVSHEFYKQLFNPSTKINLYLEEQKSINLLECLKTDTDNYQVFTSKLGRHNAARYILQLFPAFYGADTPELDFLYTIYQDIMNTMTSSCKIKKNTLANGKSLTMIKKSVKNGKKHLSEVYYLACLTKSSNVMIPNNSTIYYNIKHYSPGKNRNEHFIFKPIDVKNVFMVIVNNFSHKNTSLVPFHPKKTKQIKTNKIINQKQCSSKSFFERKDVASSTNQSLNDLVQNLLKLSLESSNAVKTTKYLFTDLHNKCGDV